MSREEPPGPSAFRAGLALLVLLGLTVRLVYGLVVVADVRPIGDGREFHLLANLLADGRGFVQPFLFVDHGIVEPTADKPPLYPLLLAAVSELGGTTLGAHRAASSVMGAGTVAVVGLIGRRVAGARNGLLAAGLAAVAPFLVVLDGATMSESLYGLLIALLLLLALIARRRPTVAAAVGLGVLVGLAALTRSEALVLGPLVALPALWPGPGRRRRLAVAALAATLVLTPWLARCWATFDRPVAISTNGGGLIAGANCAATYFGPQLGQWSFACLRPRGPGDEADEAGRQLRAGLGYAGDHLGRLPAVIAVRALRPWQLYRPWEQARAQVFFEGHDLGWERAAVLAFYVLAVLAAVGALVLRRRDRAALSLLLAPAALVIVVSVAAYGTARFRVAADVGLLVLAAIALEAALARRTGGGAADRAPGGSGRAGAAV